MKLGKLLDIVIEKNFKKDFTLFGGLGPKSRPFLIFQPTTLNPNPTIMKFGFFTLLKVCTKIIKNSKHYLLKINR